MAHPPSPDPACQAALAASSALSSVGALELVFTCEAAPDPRGADIVHIWCGRDARFSLLQAAAAVGASPLVTTVAHLPFQPDIFDAVRLVAEASAAVCFVSAADKDMAQAKGLEPDCADTAFVHAPYQANFPISPARPGPARAGKRPGRPVIFASRPPDEQEMQLLQEAAKATGLELALILEPEKTPDLRGAEAFISSPFNSSPEALALGAALAGAAVICPDTAASRELVGPCGVFWRTGDAAAGLAEALRQREDFEQDVVRARLLSLCAQRNAARVLTGLYMEACRRGPAAPSHELPAGLARCARRLSEEAEAARRQAADLHRRLVRWGNFPAVRQYLAIKKLLSRREGG
jgi:hypothetical protein